MWQMANLGGGGSGGIASLAGYELNTAISIGTTTRIAAAVLGLTTVSMVFNAGQATTCKVYGYVGDTDTLITTLSKSASAQNVTVTGYERIGLQGNSTGTVISITAVN